jgi:hypothetical protein
MSDKAFTGRTLRIAIWHEISAWGGDVETAYELPVSRRGTRVGEQLEVLESMIARGTREEDIRHEGMITAQGLTVTLVGAYESIWQAIKAFAGDITSGGAIGAYTHSRAGFGAQTEGFGLEVALVDTDTAANSKLYTLTGCQITRWVEPLVRKSGACEIQITFDAKTVTPSTGAPIAATAYTENPLDFRRDLGTAVGVLTLDDGGGADAMTDIDELTLEITDSSGMVAPARNDGRVGFRHRGGVSCRITGRAINHIDTVYETLAAARTACTLVVTMTDGDDIYTRTIANVKFASRPVSIDDSPVMLDLYADCDAPTWSGTNDTETYPTPV